MLPLVSALVVIEAETEGKGLLLSFSSDATTILGPFADVPSSIVKTSNFTEGITTTANVCDAGIIASLDDVTGFVLPSVVELTDSLACLALTLRPLTLVPGPATATVLLLPAAACSVEGGSSAAEFPRDLRVTTVAITSIFLGAAASMLGLPRFLCTMGGSWA